MTAVDSKVNAALLEFVERTTATAEHAFDVWRATGTISSSGTAQIHERVPGESQILQINLPDQWKSRHPVVKPAVYTFDGRPVLGDERAARGARRFAAIFEQHDDITTVVHIHTPYLGAWAQAHRALPINYVAVQRHTLVRELPVYIDRTQAEVDFILEQLARDGDVPAIVEANGGATVWGRDGLRSAAEYIQLLEEGAQYQTLAQTQGGSQEYGLGVLAQQWSMTGRTEAARAKNLLA
jgi:L-ribulose-5-phosphate 4-epimerase